MDEQDDLRPAGAAWSDDDVRRLLADAHLTGVDDAGEPGADARLPDDVVARLDDVLAGLVAERAADPDETPDLPTGVTSIEGARRGRSRRRVWTTAAGIAAAVVVGGAVLGSTVVPGLVQSESNDVSTTAEVDAGADAGMDAGEALESDALPSRAPVAGAPRISSDDLETDVRSFLAGLSPLAAAASDHAADEQEGLAPNRTAASRPPELLTSSRARSLVGCSVPGETAYAVSFDDRAALAVVEEPEGESRDRVVRVLVCDAAGDPFELTRVSVAPSP